MVFRLSVCLFVLFLIVVLELNGGLGTCWVPSSGIAKSVLETTSTLGCQVWPELLDPAVLRSTYLSLLSARTMAQGEAQALYLSLCSSVPVTSAL